MPLKDAENIQQILSKYHRKLQSKGKVIQDVYSEMFCFSKVKKNCFMGFLSKHTINFINLSSLAGVET